MFFFLLEKGGGGNKKWISKTTMLDFPSCQSAKCSVYFPAPCIVFCIGTASALGFCRFDSWLRKTLNILRQFLPLEARTQILICHQLSLIVVCPKDMTRFDVIRHRLVKCRKFAHGGKGPDGSTKPSKIHWSFRGTSTWYDCTAAGTKKNFYR